MSDDFEDGEEGDTLLAGTAGRRAYALEQALTLVTQREDLDASPQSVIKYAEAFDNFLNPRVLH